MHLLGYWIRDLDDEEFCAPQEVVGDLPAAVRDRVASYLDAGQRHAQYRGDSWCRFFCGINHTEMGSGDKTDGLWVWPDGLAHYVRHHSVTLPKEFVAHALTGASGASHRPVTGTSREDALGFWRAWCAAQRTQGFLDRLRCFRQEAEHLREQAVNRALQARPYARRTAARFVPSCLQMDTVLSSGRRS